MRKKSDHIAQDSLDADSFLCERCSKINVNEILSLRPTSVDGHHILDFRSGSEVVEDPNCSFCQAFGFISPVMPSDQFPCCLVAMTRKGRSRRYGRFIEREDPSEDGIFLIIKIKEDFSPVYGDVVRMLNVGKLVDHELLGCLTLRSTLQEDDGIFMADLIGSTVDLNMVRRWIKTCEKKHGADCAPSSAQNSTLRLIECDSRRVVTTPRPPEVSTYAALSYVWGSQELDEVYSEELPKRLPKTIEDAITVTKGLGIPYLWIDRYCINQDDEGEKNDQCSLMHRIYENAHVTIIAAAGSGPDHGLPGIGSSTRSYPSVRIGSHLLVPTLPDPRLSMRAAKWSTRGWTYQENQLSKRRLVFTNHQVLFVCRRACINEAEQGLKPGTELPYGDIRPRTSFSLFFWSEKYTFSIWDEINQFVILDLSHQEDCLNAMLGILQRYQESDQEYGVCIRRHLAGLPVVKKVIIPSRRAEIHEHSAWTLSICESLGWTTDRAMKKRDVPHPGFPSWSWTPWKAAKYDPESMYPSGFQGPSHWKRSIFVERPDGGLVKGRELESLFDAGHDFSRIRFIHLEAPSLNFKIISATTREWICSEEARFQRWEDGRSWVILHHNAAFCCPFQLTNLSVHIPEDGLHCWGIMIVDKNCFGELKPLFLVVTKVKDWYERIGLAEVCETEALKELETRAFRLG